MNLTLKQVRLKSFAGGVFGGVTHINARFAANFDRKVADKLGIAEDCFREENGVYSLRSFTKHDVRIIFNDARVEMKRSMDFAADSLKQADIRKMTIVVDKDGKAELHFTIKAPLNTVELTNYLYEQKKGEAPEFIITGKQLDLFDDSPAAEK